MPIFFPDNWKVLAEKVMSSLDSPTSGNSENVVKAFGVADQIGVDTILVSGNTGGKLKGRASLR